MQIIPAILATTEDEYKNQIEKITACPELAEGWVQIDFMDNKFVQNESINPEVLVKYKSDLKLEAQLMVDYPENWIDQLIKAGVARIIFPVEDGEGIEERISHIKNHGLEVGLSVNPETEVEKIQSFISKVDVILIMSVHPGFSGQEFLPESLNKVKETSRLRSETHARLKIEVDGGIDEGVVKQLVDAGADYLVIGSHLLHGDISQNLERIRQSING